MSVRIASIDFVDSQGIALEHSYYHHNKAAYVALLEAAEYAISRDIAGDVAEFGVQHGQEASLIAYGIATWEDKYKPVHRRSLHLFDSFEGYPDAHSEADREMLEMTPGEGRPGTGRLEGSTPEEMAERSARQARHLMDEARVRTHIGFFDATLPALADDQRFGMVSIDCNFYQSTRDVLDHLFRRRLLAPGAVVVFGQAWNHVHASNRHGYRKAWQECVTHFGADVEDWGPIGMLGRRFIVHDPGGDGTG